MLEVVLNEPDCWRQVALEAVFNEPGYVRGSVQ